MAGPTSQGNSPIPRNKEEEEKQAREASQKFADLLAGNPALEKMMMALGFGQPSSPVDQIAQNVLGDMTRNSFSVDAKEKNSPPVTITNPDGTTRSVTLRDFDGSEASIINNLEYRLQKAFDDKKMVFSEDPAVNQAKLNELMSDLKGPQGIVAQGKISEGNYNPSAIAQALAAKTKDMTTEFRVTQKADMPELKTRQPIQEGKIAYGAPLEITKDTLASIPFRDTNGKLSGVQVTSLTMDANGAFSEGPKVSTGNLGGLLGDKFTIERVVEGGNISKGYFLSNSKGDGFYVGADAIDLAAMKEKTPDLYNALRADPAPAPKEPAPAPTIALDMTMQKERGGPNFGAMA